jgi:hypothetical protein
MLLAQGRLQAPMGDRLRLPGGGTAPVLLLMQSSASLKRASAAALVMLEGNVKQMILYLAALVSSTREQHS